MFLKSLSVAALLLSGLQLGCSSDDTPRPTIPESTEVQDKGEPMATAKAGQVWNAYTDFPDEEDELVGQITVEEGMLRVVSAEGDDNKEFLEKIAKKFNRREELVIPGPPKGDAGRYTLSADVYKRDNPKFEQVLLRKVCDNHSLRVEPVE